MPNPSILSIQQILDCGALGLSFAIKDIEKRNAFNRGVINELIPEEIYLVYKSVKHRYDSYPSDPTLRATANLLWQLLGKYGLQALNSLEGGGQVQIVTGGGLLLIPFDVTFQINSVQFPSGQTSYTLNWRSYGVASNNIHIDLENDNINSLISATIGDFTYDVTFNLNSTVINFQVEGVPTAPDDNKIMTISGFKYA